ncbi:MAG: [FeFe] hydrogenase H-cluster radical SAM maturase HydE, partial [Synergistes sp.]|nr:[FeFe] hydrogenase H-cluster radical SAM maturase HydE [Synergistes sp.]
TSSPEHYAMLHPAELTLENRIRCLYDLKEIGYQVGCGMMVGSPYQTLENLVDDLIFIKKFDPQMVGMGPFIPHHDTPFAKEKPGTAELTLFLLAIVRLMLPKVLLPATTALGTIDDNGREEGVRAGCNVVMPNLSPLSVRKKYMLYDNKISTGDEAAEAIASLARRMKAIGYEVVTERGDYKN